MKLNLGCGDRKLKGYKNLDKRELNLDKFPYPFANRSKEEIILRNVLEHLKEPDRVMEEIKRILKKGGRVIIRVPHFSSIHAWGNLQHKRPFSIRSFDLKGFEIIRFKIEMPRIRFFMKPIVGLFPVFYEKNLAYIFPATDIKVVLEKI